MAKVLYAFSVGIAILAIFTVFAGVCFWLAGLFPQLVTSAYDIVIFGGVAFLLMTLVAGPLEKRAKKVHQRKTQEPLDPSGTSGSFFFNTLPSVRGWAGGRYLQRTSRSRYQHVKKQSSRCRWKMRQRR